MEEEKQADVAVQPLEGSVSCCIMGRAIEKDKYIFSLRK